MESNFLKMKQVKRNRISDASAALVQTVGILSEKKAKVTSARL